MYVDFQQLDGDSRIWIYQASRELSDQEIEQIGMYAKQFVDGWTKHGSDLKGSFTVAYKRFLILAVDQSFNNVSGCSIDASVHFVKGLGNELGVDFMNKMNLAYLDSQGSIQTMAMGDFSKRAKSGDLAMDLKVFNNLINSKQELESKWIVPAQESWHKRFY
ncbi:MAG: ABC transporter ATPase [Flavobacteriaceae bacterium]